MDPKLLWDISQRDPELGLRGSPDCVFFHGPTMATFILDSKVIQASGWELDKFQDAFLRLLLRRINARGWGYALSNFTWPNSDAPALMGGFTAFIYQTETGLMDVDEIEGCGQTECEALARAYLKALEGVA